MKKENINLIALIVISVLMLCIPSDNPQDGQHKCIDSTHLICDGNCSCDGMECK